MSVRAWCRARSYPNRQRHRLTHHRSSENTRAYLRCPSSPLPSGTISGSCVILSVRLFSLLLPLLFFSNAGRGRGDYPGVSSMEEKRTQRSLRPGNIKGSHISLLIRQAAWPQQSAPMPTQTQWARATVPRAEQTPLAWPTQTQMSLAQVTPQLSCFLDVP